MQNNRGEASPSKGFDQGSENEKLFMCLTCEKIFPDLTELRRHKKSTHEIESPYPKRRKKDIRPIQMDDYAKFICSFCPFTFRRKCDKEKHEQDSHTGTCLYTCSFCWCTFNNLAILKAHINRFHKEFHISTDINASRPRAKVERPVDIELEREMMNSRARQMKMRKMNLRRSRKPPSRFLNTSSSARVRKTSPVLKLRRCEDEPATSSKSSSFDGERIPTIKKSLVRRTIRNIKRGRTKKRLMTRGGVEMIYATELCCSYCPNSFASISSKLRHERFHTGVMPFTCKLCKTTFYWERSMISHKLKCRQMSIDTHIWCNFCDFHHKQEVALEQHYRNYHGAGGDLRPPNLNELPLPPPQVVGYSCDICDATFNLKSILDRHIWKNHEKKDQTRKSAMRRLERIVTGTQRTVRKSIVRQKQINIKNIPKYRQKLDSIIDEVEFLEQRDYISKKKHYVRKDPIRIMRDVNSRIDSLFEDDEVNQEEEVAPVMFNFCDVNLDAQFESNFPNLRAIEEFGSDSETLEIGSLSNDPLKIDKVPARTRVPVRKNVEPVVKDFIVIDDDD